MNIKSLLKTLKLHEGTISMILGALVIVVVGVIVINYFSDKKGETIPPFEISEEVTLPATHTVVAGEDLWKISEIYYKTGYNWVDIAEANNISNPGQIQVGQTLTIPDVEPKYAEALSPTQVPADSVVSTISKDAKTHVVAKGENLWKIAETFYNSGYNWVDISKENNLTNPGLIEEGRELIIPNVEAKSPTITTIAETDAKPESISDASYTVSKGDSLWDIAVRAYGDGYKWAQIAKENKLLNPNLIHAGNVLNLPR